MCIRDSSTPMSSISWRSARSPPARAARRRSGPGTDAMGCDSFFCRPAPWRIMRCRLGQAWTHDHIALPYSFGDVVRVFDCPPHSRGIALWVVELSDDDEVERPSLKHGDSWGLVPQTTVGELSDDGMLPWNVLSGLHQEHHVLGKYRPID